MRVLTVNELHRLGEEVPSRDRAMILVAGYLGLRWSELVGCCRTWTLLSRSRLDELAREAAAAHVLPERPLGR